MSEQQTRLSVQGVNKRFGGLQALSDVRLEIKAGEIYGLIGPNGAGKTTFFNVITGLYTPDSGVFKLDGVAYTPTAVYQVAKAGIARTFQNIRLFGGMTALENVMVGRHVRTKHGLIGAVFQTPAERREEREIKERALELLEYVGVLQYADYTSRNLSYGHQRRLEIARALATDPKLLALDEPAAGMNATEKVELTRLLDKIRSRWQDDSSDRTRREAGDGIVQPHDGARLRQGDRRGSAAGRAEGPEGDRGISGCRGPLMATTNAMLKIKGLQVNYGGIHAVKGVDLEVGQGELVTLIGANGAGKTTTMKAITGLKPYSAGDIEYMGKSIKGVPTHELLKRGLAMVPEGRGIFARMSILENMQMGAYLRNDTDEIQKDTERMFGFFPRLKERASQYAGTLSGGEQQMLAMARALFSRPKLLLLDEPSMGLSPIMVEKIFEVVREISGEGLTVLLVEQNARLALQAANRGYVMDSGLVTMTGDAKTMLDDPKVRAAYLGE